MSIDKRKFTRYPVSGEVFLKNEEGVAYKCYFESINISFGGFAVYTKEKIEDVTGKLFQFKLVTTIRGVELEGKSKNVYVHEEIRSGKPIYRLGLEFVGIHKDTISHILTAIQKSFSKMSQRIAISSKSGGVF